MRQIFISTSRMMTAQLRSPAFTCQAEHLGILPRRPTSHKHAPAHGRIHGCHTGHPRPDIAQPPLDEPRPHDQSTRLQEGAAVEIHGDREIFGMNVIGRHRRHAAITRTPSNHGLQHKGLFQVDHVRPVERSINLAPIQPGEGIALRGNKRRQQRNAKMRERIVRGTDTAIVTIERRRGQYTNVIPSFTQEHDGTTRGRRKPGASAYRSFMTNRILSCTGTPSPTSSPPG